MWDAAGIGRFPGYRWPRIGAQSRAPISDIGVTGGKDNRRGGWVGRKENKSVE